MCQKLGCARIRNILTRHLCIGLQVMLLRSLCVVGFDFYSLFLGFRRATFSPLAIFRRRICYSVVVLGVRGEIVVVVGGKNSNNFKQTRSFLLNLINGDFI